MRHLILQITIALRNIFRQRRRSFLTVLAIAFSVFCIIIFQSLKSGLHHKMIDGSLGLDNGTIQIHTAEYEANVTHFQELPDPPALIKTLAKNGISDYSTRIKIPALILAGDRSSSVLLSGINPEQEKKITFIHQRMVQGQYLTGNENSILISQPLAKSLHLAVGDKATLMLQNIYGQSIVRKLTISGLYSTGLTSFDLSRLYIPLATLQKFLEVQNSITEIAISLPAETARQVAAALTDQLNKQQYLVSPWQDLAPDLVQLIELNNATFNLLVIIVFLIVAMGIANTMNSVIFERFHEFGTMAAIGCTPFNIISLVSLESLFLGVWGCLTGTIGALIVCQYLSSHGIDLAHFTSTNQYFVAGSVLKSVMQPMDMVLANLITLATALLAGLYPAIKASRLKPVDALNYT